MVSALGTGLKVRGFKPGRGDRFLSAIQIHSTPSFGEKLKPSAPCRKIVRYVKISLEV
jgi:hypothetical protein